MRSRATTSPPPPRASGRGGFTLPELLVSLLLTTIFATATHQLCLSLLRGVALLEATSRLQEAGRIALAIIARDLRDTGYGLSTDTPGVRLASRDATRIARGLNNDGDTEDSHERIAYAFDRDSLRLVRQLGSAPPQPMLDDLAADGFQLTYFDAAGIPIAASEPLPPEDMARIHRIDLRLTLETPDSGSFAITPIRLSHATTVALRND